MADPLIDYMVRVNEDPTLMAKHNADPAQAAKDFGLEQNDIQLIVTGDQEQLRQRCSPCDLSAPPIMTFHTPV